MPLRFPQVSNNNVSWREFLCHWPLWSIYIAHFSMNWSNYIIMQWLPTYMTRTLGAEKSHIMFTAVPYIMNSLVGMGEILFISLFFKKVSMIRQGIFNDMIHTLRSKFSIYIYRRLLKTQSSRDHNKTDLIQPLQLVRVLKGLEIGTWLTCFKFLHWSKLT